MRGDRATAGATCLVQPTEWGATGPLFFGLVAPAPPSHFSSPQTGERHQSVEHTALERDRLRWQERLRSRRANRRPQTAAWDRRPLLRQLAPAQVEECRPSLESAHRAQHLQTPLRASGRCGARCAARKACPSVRSPSGSPCLALGLLRLGRTASEQARDRDPESDRCARTGCQPS
jgi:hypothetical protein